MSKFSFLLFFCVLHVSFLSAQQLTGRIVDAGGQPVPNASVYIREISLGLVADDNGNFRTHIEKGDYTMDVSSLGFEKKTVTANVPPKGLELKIELHHKVIELQEVVVTKGGEDPAYAIMRQVIARAPYFYRQLKSYESDVYLKGSFKIEKIPKIITATASSSDKKAIELLVGKLFLLESQNKVKYTQPDKYEQHVVAIKSSLPSELNLDDNLPLSIVTSNIYAPKAFGGLLSPSSFSVYKFRFEDAYIEEGRSIYKIKIIPKKKNSHLVEGYLNIVDKTWNISRAYIIQNETGVTSSYNLTYNEVKPDAFLPTSYDMSMNVSLMGIKGYGKFYSSMQYKNVETNNFSDANTWKRIPETSASSPKETAKQNVKQQKNLKKLEELAEKDKLTNREVRQMAELITQTTETDEERARKRKLEITPLDSSISVTRDTLALLRDSAFWEITRKAPLDIEELRSYIVRDSLKTAADSLKKSDSLNLKKASTWLGAILFGGNRKIGKKLTIDFAGIPKACPEYNFVDGFRLGQQLALTYDYSDNGYVKITPSAYYTTARKSVVWGVNSAFTYSPLRNGSLNFAFGNGISDYAGDKGDNRRINSIASLVFAENTAKFYQKKFVVASNFIDIANGLRLQTEAYYAKHNELTNNTSYNFLKREPHSNLPHGFDEAVMPPHSAFTVNIGLKYTPRYYYYIRKGRKYYSHSDFPTLQLDYKKALPGNSAVNPSYDKLEFTVKQQFKTDIFSRMIYSVNAGLFLNSKTMYLPDYNHFYTNELFVTDKFLYNSFVLPDNYVYATNDRWLQAHVSYNSDYLLIKRLPFLQNYLMSEDFHLKTLFLPGRNHSEVGYSIGLGSVGRLGVFAGFDDWKYKNTGFIVSFPILNNF